MDGIPKLTANELRRQRDRERYASLSVEEKAALVQKNRENRNRKNSAATSGTGVLRDITNLSLHNVNQTVDCQPSFQPVPSSTPGVLGDITNLSAVERRRKRARDKYASMSPEEKERLLQKNREYRQRKKVGASTTVTGVQGHQAMLTPRRQPFTEPTNQAFNEADADSAGDCELPISCITQLKQGGSLLVAHQSNITDTPLTPANVLTLDGSDDYSWLRRNDAYERRACYGESEDNYYQNGDTSQELFQPPSMTRGNVDLMEGEAIVDDDDDDDDESYLMRGRDIEFESYQTPAMPIDASTVADDKIYQDLPAPSVLKRVPNYCVRLIIEYHVQIQLLAQFFLLFIGLLCLVISGGPGSMDGVSYCLHQVFIDMEEKLMY